MKVPDTYYEDGVWVDIFVNDYLYRDEKKEKDRTGSQCLCLPLFMRTGYFWIPGA